MLVTWKTKHVGDIDVVRVHFIAQCVFIILIVQWHWLHMFIWACMFIDCSQVFVVRSILFSFTFGTMAPQSKKRTLYDAGLESQGPPAAPVNAMIWKDMFEPAIQYIRDLPQFADWDCPQTLKVRDDTVDNVGGFMARFSK